MEFVQSDGGSRANEPAKRALPIFAPAASGRVDRTEPRSVRISLTDRCDLACVYCRPSRTDGYFESRLSESSWHTMIRGLIAAGVRRFRITGGEPLLDPNVVRVVSFLAKQPEVEDLALTTNGTRLHLLAQPLKDAGLTRLTISLDTLDATRFRTITRGGDLAGVLEGIRAAKSAGFGEVKVNTVVVRAINDDELSRLTEWAWSHGFTPRFIEMMQIGEGANLGADRVVSKTEMLASLAHLVRDEAATRDPNRGPAKYVRARVGDHRVGFITGTTETYCAGCDRLRVAAEGTLRPCLATSDGESARGAADRGDVDAVLGIVHRAWEKKPDGMTFRGCTEESAREVSIRAIGG